MSTLLKNTLISIIKKALSRFWLLHKPFVKENIKLKNSHKGETCFIFANGSSLSSYDISKLPNNPSIVCSYSLIDKRFHSLNVKYFVQVDSYNLYIFIYNTILKKFQVNKRALLLKRIFKANKHITTFVNITNIYSNMCRRRNINYYYYFNNKDSFEDDLAGNFSNCRGALDTMLGTAKYLGFSKAVLFGCDYLGTPAKEGHFYSDKKKLSAPSDEHLIEYRNRIKNFSAKGIELKLIFPEGVTSKDFNFDTYENYFNLKKINQKNSTFIDESYLKILRDASKLSQIHM